METGRLGVVVRGSLSKGLELKLDPGVPLEELRAGMFAVASGQRYDFLSLLTDLELTAAIPEALDAPPPEPGSLLSQVLAGESIYARGTLRPHLMVARGETDPERALMPVKTIPGHFTEVRRASRADVDRVFGSEETSKFHFHLGTPIDMEDVGVCLNLQEFVRRSSGIFGKSGTGKTFLTRLVLCGLVQKRVAVNLVFDMHGEYGWSGTDERQPGGRTQGLKRLFPSQVEIFTLDAARTQQADWALRIPYSFLEPDDILSLQKVLNLNPTAAENSHLLQRRFGGDWFARALDLDVTQFAEDEGAHPAAVQALKRKLTYLERRCSAFLRPDSEFSDREPDPVERIMKNLSSGRHTVIDFGRFSDLTHYLLVANILTRRIDERWRERTEVFLSGQGEAPPPLVITIEEAHKFLEPGIAEQTTFGRIARELRKYSVTLLVVDQRPSQIEREVMSQLGTKMCCLLDDDADVEAALAGTSGSGGLRAVLAGLDTQRQALVFGHAVPMPVVLKTRAYDETFWRALGFRTEAERRTETAAMRKRDFPDD